MAGKKLTGDLAQTSIGTNITFTGTTTTGSQNITAASSIAGLAPGQAVSGTGIPAGTTIASLSGSTVVLSAAATATGTGIVISETEVQVLGLKGWTIDWGLKTAEATTTDDSGYESYLPSTANWTATASYVYLEGDNSQITFIRNYIKLLVRPVQQWNFFIDPINGDDAFTGQAFIDKLGIKSQMGAVVTQEVSLRGSGPLTPTTEVAPIVSTTVTGLQAEL